MQKLQQNPKTSSCNYANECSKYLRKKSHQFKNIIKEWKQKE